ncbi:acyltransferase family protein [Devosia sp. YIM 151766]|nr:acyltransferase family protein [Devosia sp. YIM 151766]WIY54164.1 acyltransferase family protein [Devosia sp. YIM 151766]
MEPTSTYRADIDGLRAVAVLGVLLYHYGATWLPGGFTGVDVFFVISGYLITGILRREIEAGEFSLLGFYDRRIRRIFPALLVVLVTTMVAGWFLLMPGDYADLGESAAYAAFGLGNLFFFWNTGYFDQAADLQPLLHTWSLGVEEQFYVVWPMALLALFGLTKSWKVTAFATGFLVISGFIYAAVQTASDPTAAFYLPHPRAWELGVGALLAFAPTITHRALSEAARVIGSLLIAYSLLAISAADPFPGLNAVYACVGSALLIWPSASPTLIGRVLSLRPVVGIGLISYSLYLWHWPVLVLFRHWNNGAPPTLRAAFALAIVSALLATLSWWFVERPFRSRQINRAFAFGSVIAATSLVAVASVTLLSTGGAASRLNPSAAALTAGEDTWRYRCPYTAKPEGLSRERCVLGVDWELADERWIVWGDSYSLHLAQLLDYAAPSGVSILIYHECPAIVGQRIMRHFPSDPAYNEGCSATRDEMVRFLRSNAKVDKLVLSSAWTSRLPDLYPAGQQGSDRTVQLGAELLQQGLLDLQSDIERPLEIVVLGDLPLWPNRQSPVDCAVARMQPILRAPCPSDLTGIPTSAFLARNGAAYDAIETVTRASDLIRMEPLGKRLCSEEYCRFWLAEEFIYRDDGHFRTNLPARALEQLATILRLHEI